MTGNAGKPEEDRSFVGTSDLMRISGATRNIIEKFKRLKICEPAERDQAGLLWSPSELSRVEDALTLQDGGASRKRVAQIADEGLTAIDSAIYEQAIKNNRNSRRTTKSSALRFRAQQLFDRVGHREGFYLRYMPERWIAIAPTQEGLDGLPWSRSFIGAFADLKQISQIVGWCPSAEVGSVSSGSFSDLTRFKNWAFLSLASPPMPVVTGDLVIDGGCYYVIDPVLGDPGCDTSRCFECSRFGREPDHNARKRWERVAESSPELWDDVLMAGDMTEPYKHGPWVKFTREALGLPVEEPGPEPRRPNPTLRPQRMPTVVKLPYGVSAAVIPAGVYLCKQCDQQGQDTALLQLSSVASLAEHLPLTPELEDEMQETLPVRKRRPERRKGGPYLEPFAQSRMFGDARLIGWVRDMESGEMGRIKVLTQTGLLPDDEYSIVCSSCLRDNDDGRQDVCYEMQLLVDASDILAEEDLTGGVDVENLHKMATPPQAIRK